MNKTQFLKYLIVSICFLLIINKSYSQNDLNVNADSIKIYKLINESDYYLNNGEIDKAIELGKEAVEYTDSLNNPLYIIDAASNLGVIYYNSNDFDLGLELLEGALKIAKENNLKEQEIIVYTNIGVIYNLQSLSDKALEYYQMAKELSEEINDKDKLAASLSNISNVYGQLGKYDKATPLIFEALKIDEELGNNDRVANSLNNLGNIYYFQEDYEKSLEYYLKSYEMAKAASNVRYIAMPLANIGDAYMMLGDYDLALEYLNKALEIFNSLNDRTSVAALYDYYVNIYLEMNQLNKAKEYLNKQLEIYTEIENKEGMIGLYGNLGQINEKEGDYKAALNNYYKSLILARRAGGFEFLKSIYQSIYQIYNKQDEADSALKYVELYYAIKDSIFTIEKERNISALQTEFETKEKEQEIVLQNLELEKQKELLANQRLVIVLFGFILLMTVLFSIILSRQYLAKKKSNKLLKEHQKRITSSIEYASKIQGALLTPVEVLDELFKDSFVFYQPKDIVSGDFYWFYKKNNIVFIAAADCTGHGVPGAFMSVLGISLLNEIISRIDNPAPNQILDELKHEVIKALRQKGLKEEARDGIEISLCAIDASQKKIQFSGTKQFIYFVSNNEIKVMKGDRMPIGIHHVTDKPFSQCEFNFEDGDRLYLFTDGYIDQFSENDMKFSSGRFKKMISRIQDLDFKSQQNELFNQYKSWKGNQEQIDDILVVGLKL